MIYGDRDAKRWESTPKLVGERITEEQNKQHQLARDAIAEAQVICFLGFGFDKDNMRLLGFPYRQQPNINYVLEYQRHEVKTPIVIGTAMGLSESRRREVVSRLLFPVYFPKHTEEVQRFNLESTCEQLLDDNIQTLDAEWDLPTA